MGEGKVYAMKKTFVLLTLIMTMFSAVAFANVDSGPDRWKLIGSDKKAKVYYDRETAKFFHNNHDGAFAEAWICYHFHDGCDQHAGDHYDFELLYISYKDKTFAIKATLTKGKNGEVKESREFPAKIISYVPLKDQHYETLLAKNVWEQFY